jgi:hypothetical protein
MPVISGLTDDQASSLYAQALGSPDVDVLLALSDAPLHALAFVEAQRQVYSDHTTDMVTIPYADSYGDVEAYVFFGTQTFTGGDADGVVLPTRAAALSDGTAFAAYGGQPYRATDPASEAQLFQIYFGNEASPILSAYRPAGKGRFIRTKNAEADTCPFDVVTGKPRPTDPPNPPPLRPCTAQCASFCAGVGIATVTSIALGVLCISGGILFLTVPGFQATAAQILALCRIAAAAALIAIAIWLQCRACTSSCIAANRAMCNAWLAANPGFGG